MTDANLAISATVQGATLKEILPKFRLFKDKTFLKKVAQVLFASSS